MNLPLLSFLLNLSPSTTPSPSSSTCPVGNPSSPPSASVDKLRPEDIGMVAAIGDSDTAAYASRAEGVLGFLFEDRDVSFVTGADNPTSLFSILRSYNPDLIGGSSRRNNVLFGMEDKTGLNVAVSGGVSGDASKQATDLVKKVKAVSGWEDMWKVVSIQLGSNDLCTDSCDSSKDTSPDTFRQNLEAAVDILASDLPRTMVLIQYPFDLGPLLDMTDKPFQCKLVHQFGCSCLFAQDDKESAREKMAELKKNYATKVEELAKEAKYDRTDFAVEAIPTYQGIFPKIQKDGVLQPDISLMAPDCFHFSPSLHSAIGTGIWNNLVEPADQRSVFKVGDPIKCLQHGRPYLSTRRN